MDRNTQEHLKQARELGIEPEIAWRKSKPERLKRYNRETEVTLRKHHVDPSLFSEDTAVMLERLDKIFREAAPATQEKDLKSRLAGLIPLCHESVEQTAEAFGIFFNAEFVNQFVSADEAAFLEAEVDGQLQYADERQWLVTPRLDNDGGWDIPDRKPTDW